MTPYPIFDGIDDDENNYDADLELGMDATSSDWEDSADDVHMPSDFDF